MEKQCKKCNGKMFEFGIVRNGDTRMEKITYMCEKCGDRETTEPHPY